MREASHPPAHSAGQPAMYDRFTLSLVLNHDCNMLCTYCYTGAKFNRPMREEVAQRAVDRAVASIAPGGELRLEFSGGEPLLDAPLVATLLEYARYRCRTGDVHLTVHLSTNGTVAASSAWALMTGGDLELGISHDGLPAVHNRHRRMSDGGPSSSLVLRTVRRLVAEGVSFQVEMVVRPDDVEFLSAGIVFLASLGVRGIAPRLDLWSCWTKAHLQSLEHAIVDCARIWREMWPDLWITWFDERAMRISGAVPDRQAPELREGEIAVSPSGGLYPCARLVREDRDDDPARLPGDVFAGDDFVGVEEGRLECPFECSRCGIRPMCAAESACTRYMRSGDSGRPDELLCTFSRVCYRETLRAMESLCGIMIGSA